MNTDGTAGSGCTPPAGDTLPDGIWAAFVTDWGTHTLTTDLVCWYALDSEYVKDQLAQEPYREDTDPRLGVVNNNSRIRVLPVASNATFIDIFNGAEEVPFEEVPFFGDGQEQDLTIFDYYKPPRQMLVWLYINGGAITQIEPHFDP